MDNDDIINYLGKIGTNGASEAILLIKRQADAIRVLREAMDDLLTDYERHTDSAYCELSTEDTLIDASNNAIAQTKEFVE